MDKRYQVFVSSTYADLKEERARVFQTLMEMDCIPAGMEIFPAADMEQWKFIQRVIDDCDYYLLIIGGRYGSLTAAGISYTEREFDYAIERGIKVIAFLHAQPDAIVASKTELDPSLRDQLLAFREKVAKDRLVKFWSVADELPGLVALSLTKTIRLYPAVGWMRANAVESDAVLTELTELQKQNRELQLEKVQWQQRVAENLAIDLAPLTDEFQLEGSITLERYGKRAWRKKVTWAALFSSIAPSLLEHPVDMAVRMRLAKAFAPDAAKLPQLDEECFQSIKVQFMALDLVRVEYLKTTKEGMALFWALTPRGRQVMLRARTTRAKTPSVPPDDTGSALPLEATT